MASSTSNGTATSAPIIRFTNVRLVRNGRLTVNEELWIQGGRILNPEPVFFDQRVFADISVDCRQLIIAPGYIELQINGNGELTEISFCLQPKRFYFDTHLSCKRFLFSQAASATTFRTPPWTCPPPSTSSRGIW